MAVGLSLAGLSLRSPVGLIVTIVLSAGVMAGLAGLMTRGVKAPLRASLRLTPTTARDILTAGAGIAGLGIAVDSLLGLMAKLAPSLFDEAALRVVFDAFATAGPVETVLLAVVISLGPGLAEELGFRGFVLRCLEEDVGMPLAVLGSSVLFGIVHGNVLQGTGAGLIGVYLGLIVWRTGSLLPAMAAHATNNLISAVTAIYQTPGAPLFEERPLWMPAAGLAVCMLALFRLRPSRTTPSPQA